MEINHRTKVLLRHLSHDGDKNKNQNQNDEVNQNNQDSQDWDNDNDNNNDNDNDNDNHHHDNKNNNPTNDNHHKKQKQWKEKYNLDLELFVQQLPKVELHVHLDGSFDPDVLWTYIQQHKPASLECLPEQTVLPWEDDDNDIDDNDINDDKNKQEKNEQQEEEESLSRNILRVRDLVTQCQSRQEYHNLITCRTPPPPPPRPLFHHKQQKQQQQRHDQGGVVVVHDHSYLQNPPQQRHRRRRRRSLKEMLKCFEIFLPTVRQNLPFLEHLAYDFCQRQWQQNCVYTEVRYSPFLLAENLNNTTTTSYNNDDKKKKKKPVMVTGEDVFLCITRGLRRGCREFGNNNINNNHRHQRITINQILCCITWRPDWAQPTLDLVKKYQHDYPCATVGIDIAAGEEHFDKERFPNLHYPHYNVIQQARRDGIPITLHAGEVPQKQQQQDTHKNNNDNYKKKKNAAAAAENVRRSVQEYGASRIGHGYHMVLNHDLMMEMKQAGIHFEVCPTSSVETGAWPGIITTSTTSTIQNMEEEEENEDDDNQRQESQRKQDKQQDMVLLKDWMKHPGRIMQLNHLSISLNSDDPAVFHTSLAWQYRIGLVKMGMNQYDLYQSNLNAINAAFCDDETKQQIRQQIHEFWQQQQQHHFNNEEEDDKNKNDKDNNKNNKAVVSQSNKDRSSQPVVVVNRSLYKNHAMSHSANELPTTNNNDNNNNQSDHHHHHPQQQQQQPSQLFYRRSVSENFADRVYLETLDYDNDYDDDDENFNDDHVKYNDVEEEETNNVQKERIRVVFT